MIVVSMSNAGDTSGSNLVIMANGVGVASTAGGGGEGAVNLAVTRLREDEKKTQVVSTAFKKTINSEGNLPVLNWQIGDNMLCLSD